MTGNKGKRIATIEIQIIGDDVDDDGNKNGKHFNHTIKSYPAVQAGISEISSWFALVCCLFL